MTAFDLQDEFDRYRAAGGRHCFVTWADRYGDDYDCDGAWLAEDYLSVVCRHEDAGTTPPTFRAWLEGETQAYRDHHCWSPLSVRSRVEVGS